MDQNKSPDQIIHFMGAKPLTAACGLIVRPAQLSKSAGWPVECLDCQATELYKKALSLGQEREELIRRGGIPLNQCEHGWIYLIASRNLDIGVFEQAHGGFVGIREKFGSEYPFMEFHQDRGPPFGTVRALKKLEKCPLEDLAERGPTICKNCKALVVFTKDDPKGWKGTWSHQDSTDCATPDPVTYSNQALLNYLFAMEFKYGLRPQPGPYPREEVDGSEESQ